MKIVLVILTLVNGQLLYRNYCRGKANGLYRHPIRCSKFIHCHQDGATVIKTCPNDLKWNDEAKVCDWEENANCKYFQG